MTRSCLLGGERQEQAESDVIFTSVLLGFVLTRALLRQPFSFDTAYDAKEDEVERLNKAVDGIIRLVAISEIPGADKCADVVSAGLSPEHSGEKGALITGRRW